MLRTAHLRLLAAAAVAIGVAACSTDSTTGPSASFTISDAQITKDVASDAGDDAASTADVMISSEAVYGASADVVGAEASVMPTVTCSGPSQQGWFSCTADTEKGLSVTRSIRFWNGNSVALWFGAQTDSVNHALTITGTLNPSASRTVWVNRNDTLTMAVTRGTSPKRTWAGHGERADSSFFSDTNVVRIYHYTATNVVTNVVFNVPRSSNPYPASGTITHSATIELHASKGSQIFTKTTTRTASVTFNGTADVPLTVGGLTCSLNLDTHKVTNCQ